MPDGCIAALPAQSGQSCEGVIAVLVSALEDVTSQLAHVVWFHVYHQTPTDEELDECAYMETVRDCRALLDDLARDWGHLDIWETQEDRDRARDQQTLLDLDDTRPCKQGR